ncbi:MAG: helix-turn-helix domain-containing protein [Acidobacteria bacterium]|nr:helix-turn-helix domain-containing protein [Acidobacteriota bacterium]
MTETGVDAKLDRLVFGHRLRAARKSAGLTLAQLGERVGRPPPYLSKLENGKVEPKLSMLSALSDALDISVSTLVEDEPPNERASMEIEFERLQAESSYQTLGLGYIKPSKLDDVVLSHLIALARREALPGSADGSQREGDQARQANIALREEMRERDNYFPEIESLAAEALDAVGYSGIGPLSERLIFDLAKHFGFAIERVHGMPRSARSVTDQRSRVIYIPQRDYLRVRQARSVVLQTLGHFALAHNDTRDFGDYLRQRIESNYFAAALLAPREPVVNALRASKEEHDISIEDLKETFYTSYEMAAHRFTNLATNFLDIPVHFLRTDPEGVITKAFSNDGIPLPIAQDGSLEGQRVSRYWGARQAWASSDSFLLHYQLTTTDRGQFWCVTYIETVTDRTPSAVTIGTTRQEAKYFRGGDTIRHVDAREAATRVDPELVARWKEAAWPSAAERSYVLTALPAGDRSFTPFPGVDLTDVYRFLQRQTGPGTPRVTDQ